MDWSQVDYFGLFLSAVWILTLTAPILSIVMLNFSKSVSIKINLGWPESEYILIFEWIISLGHLFHLIYIVSTTIWAKVAHGKCHVLFFFACGLKLLDPTVAAKYWKPFIVYNISSLTQTNSLIKLPHLLWLHLNSDVYLEWALTVTLHKLLRLWGHRCICTS